jgi:hypothetical protein
MRKWLVMLMALLVIWGMQTSTAWAYSYGKPDEDPVADAYQKAYVALNKKPADFATAEREFKQVRAEMAEHAEIGPQLTNAIEQNLQAKKADQALFYWRQALVRNIQRRLDNLSQDFNDYSKAKVLLAKAYGTFKVLNTLHLKQDNSSLSTKLDGEFQKALNALGNPGLFGVGKKPADRKQFEASKKIILSELEKQYIPTGEKVTSGGKGHIGKGPSEETLEDGEESPLEKWGPLTAIVIVVVGAVALFTWLGRRKRHS